MQRITTGILLALAAAFLFGCGGSSAPAPDTGGNNGGSQQGKFNEVVTPTSSKGSSLINKPGQINVVGADNKAHLQAELKKYGYTLLHFKNGYSTVQVPVGQEQQAITNLTKEYDIVKAEPVRVIVTPRAKYDLPTLKSASFYPIFPDYGEVIFGLGSDGAGGFTSQANFVGQAFPMNAQGFNGGWQVTIGNATVASQPVEIAIIDAGWYDYSIDDQPGLNDTADDANVPGTSLDVANSGFVDGAGNFTPGLTAATWDVDPTNNNFPYRLTGAVMLGTLAGGSDGFVAAPQGADLDGSGQVDEGEVWNVGIMGCNPNASYMLIKTGTLTGGAWGFSDAELAASIDHAVAGGANIIVLGMSAPGTVSANLHNSIAAARAAGVLVVASAGDIMGTFNDQGDTDPSNDTFDGTTVDIQTDNVTPGSDAGVLSVAAGGVNRSLDILPTVDFGNGPIPNDGVGWFPNFRSLIGQNFTGLATWSNKGANIAATGFGLGFGPSPFLQDGGGFTVPGITYVPFLDEDFGSSISTAYVAGAASMVFQTLSQVNGTPPTDVEVQNELLSTVQFKGMTGVDDPTTAGPDDGGLLDAGLAVTSAVNGGNLVTTLPALQFTSATGSANDWLSQPVDGVTRGTDVVLTPTIANGTAPIDLTVDWGDGTAPDVINGWVSGDPITHSGGYADLGKYVINVNAKDANDLTATALLGIHVINPMAVNITIETATGSSVAATALKKGTTYRFNANPSDPYTGDGNVTSFSWDFNGDATEDATGPAPTFSFPSSGTFTVKLTIKETKRPDTSHTLDVTVSN